MSKTLRQAWRDEFCQEGFCILCGNTGEVQTTARIPGGYAYGVKMPCICPNGRALKMGRDIAVTAAMAWHREAGSVEVLVKALRVACDELDKLERQQ